MFRTESSNHDVIHVLRFLMYPEGIGVLDRLWEFRFLFGGIAYPYRMDTPAGIGSVCPEFQDTTPCRINGTRLVERAALVFEFEDTELVRLTVFA